MPHFLTIGYGDRAGYERTPQAQRDKAHAQDKALVAAGAQIGIAGAPVQVRNPEASGVEVLNAPYLMSARTVADSRILVLPAESFRQRLADDAKLAHATSLMLARYWRRLVRQIMELKLRSASERLAAYLLSLTLVWGLNCAVASDVHEHMARVTSVNFRMETQGSKRARRQVKVCDVRLDSWNPGSAECWMRVSLDEGSSLEKGDAYRLRYRSGLFGYPIEQDGTGPAPGA